MEKYVRTTSTDRQRIPVGLNKLQQEKMSFRHVTAVRVDTVLDDTQLSDKPLWRGDHTFSSDAAKYSLLNFIEPEIETDHPEWSKQKVRTEALVQFEKRMAQDLQYEQKEADHVETTVQWRVVETEPGKKELVTEYGGELITLKKLWDHTREYAAFVGNADAYNPEEEKAQIAMEQAFIKGDTHTYVSVLSHPDAVRYVQVWERGSDGDVVSKQIDLYTSTGRDFSPSEGEQLIQQLAQYQQQMHGVEIVHSDAHYAHFMVNSGVVSEQDIRTIAIFAATRTETESFPTPNYSSARVLDTPKQILRERWTMFSDVAAYVREEIHTKVMSLRRLKNEPSIRRPEKRPVFIPANTTDKEKESNVLSTEPGSKEHVVRIQSPNDAIAVPEFHKPEKMNPIKSILSEWVITNTILSYTKLRPQGAGAAVFWMSYLLETHAEKLQKPTPAFGLKKRLLYLRDAIYARIAGRMFGRELSKNQQEDKKKNIHLRTSETAVKPQKFDICRSTKNAVSRITSRFETVRFVRQARILLKELSQKIVGIQINHPPKTPDRAPYFFKEKEVPVYMVEFALLYWMILSHAHKEIRHRDKETRGDKFVSETIRSPWVLYGIIWYLAMIRESGNSPSGMQPAKVQQSTFPQFGIIYIYVPTDAGNVGEAFVIE